MSDPTQQIPTTGGPPAGTPPPAPPTGGPGGPAGPGGPGGPEGPGGPGGPEEPEPEGMDRRLVAILATVGAIVVLLIVLLVVLLTGDDDGEEDVATTATSEDVTTTSEQSTTTSEPTATTEDTTTTTSSTTSTTTSTTTTTTTRPTTTTTSTIPPGDCDDAAEQPETTAQTIYEAWTVKDRDCFERLSVDDVDSLEDWYATNGSTADWTFEGCDEVVVPDPAFICAFSYNGNTAELTLQDSATDGWQVSDIQFFT